MKRQSRERGPWKLSLSSLFIALLIWSGTFLMLYPTMSNWIFQFNQSRVLMEVQEEAKHVDPPPEKNLALAHQYNNALQFGALVEANHRLPTGFGVNGDDSLDYQRLLRVNEAGMMGRISVPAADVDLPIYHGTSDDVLLQGIGHLEGTSLPVGGIGTHTVVTGHRGLASALMFTNLDRVKVGDTFTFSILTEVLTYQVTQIQVVDPGDTESLRADPDKDLATLITCTPLGINTHRILVTGERIVPTPPKEVEKAHAPSELPHFPWWIAVLLGVTVLAVVFVWRSGYGGKRRKRDEDEQQAAAEAALAEAQARDEGLEDSVPDGVPIYGVPVYGVPVYQAAPGDEAPEVSEAPDDAPGDSSHDPARYAPETEDETAEVIPATRFSADDPTGPVDPNR